MKSSSKTQDIQVSGIKTQFIAEVEFGRPSKDCRNFGICRIHPVGEYQKICTCSEEHTFAIVTVFDQNYVEFDFLRQSICSNDYKKFFSKGKFKVEEDFKYVQAEDDAHHFIIAKGEYYIFEDNSIIKIVCR